MDFKIAEQMLLIHCDEKLFPVFGVDRERYHCYQDVSPVGILVMAKTLGFKAFGDVLDGVAVPPDLRERSVWSLAVTSELLTGLGCTPFFMDLWDLYVSQCCRHPDLQIPKDHRTLQTLELASPLLFQEMKLGMRHVIPMLPLEHLLAIKNRENPNKLAPVVETMIETTKPGHAHLSVTMSLPRSFKHYIAKACSWIKSRVSLVQEIFGDRSSINRVVFLEHPAPVPRQTKHGWKSFMDKFKWRFSGPKPPVDYLWETVKDPEEDYEWVSFSLFFFCFGFR